MQKRTLGAPCLYLFCPERLSAKLLDTGRRVRIQHFVIP
jgi:hypothetical protein